jgi:hypothetical protein
MPVVDYVVIADLGIAVSSTGHHSRPFLGFYELLCKFDG